MKLIGLSSTLMTIGFYLRHLFFYCLRHTYATRAIENEMAP
jgi:integrase